MREYILRIGVCPKRETKFPSGVMRTSKKTVRTKIIVEGIRNYVQYFPQAIIGLGGKGFGMRSVSVGRGSSHYDGTGIIVKRE
jgi:hypothetical protein